MPGKPAWQRYFSLQISIDDHDERLRPGMSVIAHVLARERENALLVPRRAVAWRGNTAYVRVNEATRFEDREVSLGAANDTDYEVLSGLRAGDVVALK